jgi:hypothetical protein
MKKLAYSIGICAAKERVWNRMPEPENFKKDGIM